MNLRPVVSLSLITALAVLTALSAEAALPRDCSQQVPGYSIQVFHEQEAQVRSWSQIYNQAPSGSAREREADIKRRAHARAALETIQLQGALTQYGHLEIDAFANEVAAKYNQASSGSFLEATYLSARDTALSAYLAKGIENLNCPSLDLDSTLDGIATYQSLYNQASSGSRRETIYRQLRDTGYAVADVRVEQLLRYSGLSHREIESLASDYQNRYNQASSGSRAETFYRRARDIARSELARRGNVNPVPIPVPQPSPICPDPNTRWDSNLRRCVSRF